MLAQVCTMLAQVCAIINSRCYLGRRFVASAARGLETSSRCSFTLSAHTARGRGVPCAAIQGSIPRLPPCAGQDSGFTDLLAHSVDEVRALFAGADLPSTADRLRTEIVRRLEALDRVGLGLCESGPHGADPVARRVAAGAAGGGPHQPPGGHAARSR